MRGWARGRAKWPSRIGWSLLSIGIALAMGCAALPGGGASSLLARGKTAVEKGELLEAYAIFKRIEREYPDSEENHEAWHYAVAIFQRKYQELRHKDPRSPWVSEEPEFLYGWLVHRVARGDGDKAARILFRGMPWSLYQAYLAWAEGRPETAGWRIVAEEDNGIIEKVEIDRS